MKLIEKYEDEFEDGDSKRNRGNVAQVILPCGSVDESGRCFKTKDLQDFAHYYYAMNMQTSIKIMKFSKKTNIKFTPKVNPIHAGGRGESAPAKIFPP